MIKCNQNAWLTPYVDLNTDLRKKQKIILKNIFLDDTVFRKTMGIVRKHRDIDLVTREKTRNYLVSKPNYYTSKFFTEHLLATEMKKAQILMNKTVYLALSVLELSKILMCEFWYDYVKPKYSEKAKCVICIKTVLLYT